MSSSIAPQEIAQFSAHADDWWNPDGKFKPLHRLNPVRVEYVRDQICAHFERNPASRASLKGLAVLDVGCGGGLLAEPLARLGANVTGIDASENTIAIAQKHARQMGLKIDYRVSSVEGLFKKNDPSPAKTKDLLSKSKFLLPMKPVVSNPQGGRNFDVITALEVAEHVADMESFLEGVKQLLKPSGLLIMSTLNRTPKSFLLGIVAAEYVLGWVPRGTHQWNKFIRPSELVQQLEQKGMRTTDLTGLIFNPLRNEFELSETDLAVNYMLTAFFAR